MPKNKTVAKINALISELESLRDAMDGVGHAVSIKALLEQALEELENVRQYVERKKFDTSSDNFIRATQLIELIEVYDCGSTGGFGKGQLINNEEGSVYMDIYHELFARFLWLYEKYVATGKNGLIPPGISGDLAEYWKRGDKMI